MQLVSHPISWTAYSYLLSNVKKTPAFGIRSDNICGKRQSGHVSIRVGSSIASTASSLGLLSKAGSTRMIPRALASFQNISIWAWILNWVTQFWYLWASIVGDNGNMSHLWQSLSSATSWTPSKRGQRIYMFTIVYYVHFTVLHMFIHQMFYHFCISNSLFDGPLPHVTVLCRQTPKASFSSAVIGRRVLSRTLAFIAGFIGKKRNEANLVPSCALSWNWMFSYII